LILVGIIVALALMTAAILVLIKVRNPLLVYLTVVWYFYLPSIMLESKTPTTALRHSQELVRANWWRVFVIRVVFALTVIDLAVISLLATSIRAFLMPLSKEIFNGGVRALIFPATAIGAALAYRDLRARKEGYTLGEMASKAKN
jgi:hypothetical protein